MIGWTYRRAKRVWQKIHPTPLAAPTSLSVRCREIEPADLDGVIDLLMLGFWRAPRSYWVGVMHRLAAHQTPEGFPKYGYMLENDGKPVGVLLMIFTARCVDGHVSIRCGESSYYVDPRFRFYASVLIKRAHRNKDVTYLDHTASPHRWSTLDAQGYKRFAQGIYATRPALCASPPGVRVHKITGYNQDSRLEPFENDLLATHAKYEKCISVVCDHRGAAYPFVFTVRRRYGMPYAQLVYCRDQSDFVTLAGALGRFFARRGILVVELDTDAPIPGLRGKFTVMPKFWHGPERPRQGDLAYTETPMFGGI